MEGFGNLLRELGDVVKRGAAAKAAEQGSSAIPQVNSISPQHDEVAERLHNSTQIAKRNQQRKMQQREDDEEGWELDGGRRRGPAVGPSTTAQSASNNFGDFALGAIGIAAAGFGVYALAKAYTTSTPSQPSLVVSTQSIQTLLREMMKDIEEFPVIGMDCQWRVFHDEIRNPIALLQLCTHKGKVMLLQLQKVVPLPKEVKDLLLNPNIIKVGIEGTKDTRYLREDYQIEVRSTFDLRFLAEETGNRPEGLEKLSKAILNLDIGRDWEIISSDWDQATLEPQQIAYAETAVKASIDIFKTLFAYLRPGNKKQDALDYCGGNLDRPFTWYTGKWD